MEVAMQVAPSDPLRRATGNIQEITSVEGLVSIGNIPDYSSGSFHFCTDLQPISDNVRSNFAVAVIANALLCTNMPCFTYSELTCPFSMIRPSPKLLSLLFLAAMTLAVHSPQHAAAQSGTVTYEHTIVLDIKLPPEMGQLMEQFKDMIPESITKSYVMDFNESLSNMRLIEERRKAKANLRLRSKVQTGRGNDGIVLSFRFQRFRTPVDCFRWKPG